ncbi:hypothetical protein G7046_g2648 [Stylonectria norvegica]|nr:hypothetical protein G7046_g2648 [Stylonectria norvegica]
MTVKERVAHTTSYVRMSSWITISEDSDFSLQNLPYGIFSTADSGPRIGVAIGHYVLDLKSLAQEHILDNLDFDTATLEAPRLNSFAGLGRTVQRSVRKRLQEILSNNTNHVDMLRDNAGLRQRALVPLSDVRMHLPMDVGDYTDFFTGLYHGINCAEILKKGARIEDICPNFFSMPVGYHGRSSSVVVSGTPVHRPKGQYPIDGTVTSAQCQTLDFEAEFAVFIGQGNKMGTSIDVNEAEEHIFGYVLMNDWSARDIQMWESSLLGPMNGKNFCTTISPWIVTPEALEPFRTSPIPIPPVLPYLTQEENKSVYDIPIQVSLQTDSTKYSVAECNSNNVIFSFAQMIAHHTRGGCPLRSGDLIATGTISGPTQNSRASFLELSLNGAVPHVMEAESLTGKQMSRGYLEDGDSIEFRAQMRRPDGLGNVGFGVCEGTILAAN